MRLSQKTHLRNPVVELPAYLEGIEVGEETVTVQNNGESIELNREYAQDVVNWLEKKSKAPWIKQRADQMGKDQALAYQTLQSISDKYKSVQTAPTEQKTFTADEWAAYEKFAVSTFGSKIIGDIDKSQGVEEQEETKEEPKKEPPKYIETVAKTFSETDSRIRGRSRRLQSSQVC